jgi:hypothetical protein
MKNFYLIVLITFHECKECLFDLIHNIKKFNTEKIAIFVSNGTEYDFQEIDTLFL